MTETRVKVSISKFPKRRVDTTPMRQPGEGTKVQVEVLAYPETIARWQGSGSMKRLRAQRAAEAEARVKAWRKLSLEQQLDYLNKNNHTATRQRARILAQIEKNKQAKQAPPLLPSGVRSNTNLAKKK